MRSPTARSRGFTLIELLVVVTIIVVLLALLTPALDKAIYQAELTVCGTRMHAIGLGAQTYAMDFKRWYPRHPAAGDFVPFMIKHASAWDFRSTIKGYIGLKHLLDPLAGKVDLATTTAPTEHQIFGTTVIWFGWGYQGESKGMRKLGDRVSFRSRTTSGDAINPVTTFGDEISADILASDIDMIDSGLSRNSHFDHDGVMQLVVRQDAGVVDMAEVGFSAGVRETSSWWFMPNPRRGLVDTNYVYGDGSVARFYGVDWEEYALPGGRMNAVGCNPNSPGSWATRRLHLPK
jgi:prepilin-type N-terminal cleavage/methylation domain-containing protein